MKIKKIKEIILLSAFSLVGVSIIPSVDAYAMSNDSVNIDNNVQVMQKHHNSQEKFFSFSNRYFFEQCRKQGINPIKILGFKDYQQALKEDEQREGKNWFHLYKKHGHWYITVGLSSHVINIIRSATEEAGYKLLMSILANFVDGDDFNDMSAFIGYFVRIIKSLNKTGHGEWWHIRLHPLHVVSHGKQ